MALAFLIIVIVVALAGLACTVWVLSTVVAQRNRLARWGVNHGAQQGAKDDIEFEVWRLVIQMITVIGLLTLPLQIYLRKQEGQPPITWDDMWLVITRNSVFIIVHLGLTAKSIRWHYKRVAWAKRKAEGTV